MKNFFVTIFFFCLSYLASAQITGTGTLSNPFTGTLTTGEFTINPAGSTPCPNPCYFNQIVVSGGILHITNPVNLIMNATSLTSFINIVGDGVIDAGFDGWGSTITFSTTLARWGGIIFSSNFLTAESHFFRCIIEKGYSSTNGGGIRISTTTGRIAIAYCEIRGNSAVNGGGISINGPRQSVYRNRIYNNTATGNGGGIFLEGADNTSDIRTDIIHHNSASNGGGVYLSSNVGAVRLCDLTIVSNTAGTGADIYHAGGNAESYNVIAWGSANSVYVNPGLTTYRFFYCAMQGYSGAAADASCIILGSGNNDSNGPHFTDPAANNYLITFSSPCRDKGTHIWKYSWPTIPPVDIRLLNRVGETDIGAFEVQYSRWTGATNNLWATTTNWEQGGENDENIYPESTLGTGDVIIPAGLTNYPTGSVVQDFTLGASRQMIIEPGANVTLDALTNNGTLNLNSGSNSTGSLILNSYSGSGTANIQLYLTGGGDANTYAWHYISLPVQSLPTGIFTGTTLDLARFVESRVTTISPIVWLNGWIGFDGWSYLDGSSTALGFTTLDLGKGYNYYSAATTTINFSGTINCANAPQSLTNTGSDPYWSGYNLLGNPFTCGLDIQYMFDHGWPSNVAKTVWFTSNNQFYTYQDGAGGAQRYIPPMQGFFVKASGSATFNFPLNARVHTSTPRYK